VLNRIPSARKDGKPKFEPKAQNLEAQSEIFIQNSKPTIQLH